MRKHANQPRTISFEPLEPRVVMSASTSTATSALLNLLYSIDGTGNNQANPNWGAANQPLYRDIVTANYADGISALNDKAATDPTVTLPSARDISNLLGTQTDSIQDDRDLSAFIYAWGQFIDHDLDLTPDGGTSAPITTPADDPQFAGSNLPFTRSLTAAGTGTGADNPLNQLTVITSFLDGSQVYGSSAATAAALRTGVGGLLKTSPGNLLPLNSNGTLAMANNSPFPSTDMFMTGDIRGNENIELTAIQTLFMREHNRQAGILAKLHPDWTDEQLYQGARQIVIAEIQSITFNQYLPALLDRGAITPYTGYDPTVNPGIAPEFSEAAFRVGHTQLDDDVEFFKNNGSALAFSINLPGFGSVDIDGEVQLAEAFFNPYILSTGPSDVEGAILKYLSSTVAQAVDGQMVDSVRNILFVAPGTGAGGMDLFALDVQRGRDVGLPTFNEARVAYGLPAVTKFSQISSDPAVQAQLKQLYGSVDNVELFVGGIVEDHVRGSSLGATFQAIIANQFERIRDGDRLWYQNIFSGAQLRAIQNTTLADIIRANTNTFNVQDNVFQFRASISGTISTLVFTVSRFGVINQLKGLAGIAVNLVNLADNEVVASTTTDGRGNYSFDINETAQYQVQLVLSGGNTSLNVPLTKTINVTRGDQFFDGIDFILPSGITPTPNPRPPVGHHPFHHTSDWWLSHR